MWTGVFIETAFIKSLNYKKFNCTSVAEWTNDTLTQWNIMQHEKEEIYTINSTTNDSHKYNTEWNAQNNNV